MEEMVKFLATLALSSTSCIRYLSLHVNCHGLLNDPKMIRQLLWDHKYNLRELFITGKLSELAEIFEQQQHLSNTFVDASLIRITRLKFWKSNLKKDPMPVLEKIATLRDLDLGNEAYPGKEMVCSVMGFPKLTHLRLWCISNLEKWRVEEGSMPILEYLEMDTCSKLEELPHGIIFLNSFRKLKLWSMLSELYDRVRVVNDVQGPDFYKVAHIPDLTIVIDTVD